MRPAAPDPAAPAARPYDDTAECLADLARLAALLPCGDDGGGLRAARQGLRLERAWAALEARVAATRSARRFIPWVQLVGLFQLGRQEQAVLAAALTDGTAPPGALPPGSALTRWHLIEADGDGGVRLAAVVSAYLLGQAAPRPRLGEALPDLPVPPSLDAMPVSEATRARLDRILALATGAEPEAAGVLLLAQGSDQPLLERLCAAAYAHLGVTAVRLDGGAVRGMAAAEPSRPAREARFRILCRDLLLSGRAVVAVDLQSLTGEDGDGGALLDDLLQTLFEAQPVVAVINGSQRLLMDRAHGQTSHRVVPVVLAVERPDAILRRSIWRQRSEEHGLALAEATVDRLAEAYPFTDEEIRLALLDASARRLVDPQLDLEEVIRESCRDQSRRSTLAVAEEVRSRFRFGDIVLTPGNRDALAEVLTHVRHRRQVIEDWGFSALSDNAASLCVLFHGPSGTGKTMAASIIANELGLGLYKIDLANVFSKYIGETEKHLAQLFDRAEAMNVVLFFDEAESLFARRTETNDSHDRYANLQTGYLLQRIERYAGIVVLSTNLLKNMDTAFTRRFRFIVEFRFPGPAERLALWQRAFPPAAPCAADIDRARLAECLALSGGNINTVALSAAFLAAAEDGPIRMAHVVRSAETEYAKLGKMFPREDFTAGVEW